MEIRPGDVGVVTGAGSGIGLALAEALARAGCNVVLADVDEAALERAGATVGELGVETLEVICDVSDVEAVGRLEAAARERFGAVDVLCNNAGVMSRGDPWTGPLATWQWVMGVNFWGVVQGIRAFLPAMVERGSGYIVNTASIAGLLPGFGPSYDASKHAVVAISEDLFRDLRQRGVPVGVSVLCPGWVRTAILDAERNWPAESLGQAPAAAEGSDLLFKYVRRAVDEATTPAAVADLVVEAVRQDRFWVLPHPDFVELCTLRWADISEGVDPVLFRDTPGLPPMDQMIEELLNELGGG